MGKVPAGMGFRGHEGLGIVRYLQGQTERYEEVMTNNTRHFLRHTLRYPSPGNSAHTAVIPDEHTFCELLLYITAKFPLQQCGVGH